jgi:hypothetical protein
MNIRETLPASPIQKPDKKGASQLGLREVSNSISAKYPTILETDPKQEASVQVEVPEKKAKEVSPPFTHIRLS